MWSLASRRGVVMPLSVSRSTTSRRGLASLTHARAIWGDRLALSEEVEHALHTAQPLIALESAIITHGMPYPTNHRTASSLESIIRARSVVPATIALINGRIHVGLSASQLEQLADPESETAKGGVKVSRRDLAPALSLGKTGGTTVAGTMYIASSLGIKVFVTGGIGGVHRGAESSMDISADLIELGRTPMAVFCAGAKSILDIPRTLEVLETQGVCVATYGDKQDFPAFYHPSSGCQSPWRVPDSDSAAKLIHTSLTLPTPLSTLLAVPIPSEHSDAGSQVQRSVEQAVRESVEQGVDKKGKEVTPWLLKRVGELTKGKALDLNIKLIENNGRVGAEVALKLAELYRAQGDGSSDSGSGSSGTPHASGSVYVGSIGSKSEAGPSHVSGRASTASSTPTPLVTPTVTSPLPLPLALPSPTVLVFGSAAIDLTSTSPHKLEPRTTTPGTVFVSPGGVGRNIAEAAQRMMSSGAVQMISAYGAASSTSSTLSRASVSARMTAPSPDPAASTPSSHPLEPDAFGKLLFLELAACGLRTDGLIPTPGQNTAVCSLTLERDGDLVAGVADMGIVETLTEEVVKDIIRTQRPKMVVFDTNLLEGTLRSLLTTCQDLGIPTFCDPTSTPKLPRLLPSLLSLLPTSTSHPRPLSHLSPNVLELDLLHSLLTASISDRGGDVESRSWEYINSLNLGSDWRNMLDRFVGVSGGAREWMTSEGVVQKMVALLPFVGSFWVKASSRGLLHLGITSSPPSTDLQDGSPQPAKSESLIHKLPENGYLVLTHYAAPAIHPSEITSTTGAGDTLVGGLVAGLVQGGEESAWVARALEGVRRSLMSRRAVG